MVSEIWPWPRGAPRLAGSVGDNDAWMSLGLEFLSAREEPGVLMQSVGLEARD